MEILQQSSFQRMTGNTEDAVQSVSHPSKQNYLFPQTTSYAYFSFPVTFPPRMPIHEAVILSDFGNNLCNFMSHLKMKINLLTVKVITTISPLQTTHYGDISCFSPGAILPVITQPEGEAAHLLSHSLEEKKKLPFIFRIISTPFNTWKLIPGAMLPLVE